MAEMLDTRDGGFGSPSAGLWTLLVLLPLLLAWKSYGLASPGLAVQVHWGPWDYVSSCFQDLLAWCLLYLIWDSLLRGHGKVRSIVTLVACNLLLLGEAVDARTKVKFLQPLSLGLLGFGLEEAELLWREFTLFSEGDFWVVLLASHLLLNLAPLIPIVLRRIHLFDWRGLLAASTGLEGVLRWLCWIAIVPLVVGSAVSGAKPYALHRNFFVGSALAFFYGDVPGHYGHRELPTDQPVRLSQKSDYASTADPTIAVAKGRNVVLFVLESTSHQATSFESPDSTRTPFYLDLADRGALVAPCYVAFAASTKSMFTLLTGTYAGPMEEVLESQIRNLPGLTRALNSAGYYTEFVSSQKLVYQGTRLQCRNLGFQQILGYADLEVFARRSGLDLAGIGFGAANDRVMFIRGLDHLKRRQPFLVTYYTTGSHYPYRFPGYDENDTTVERYEHSLSYTDRVIQEFVGDLERAELLDNTMVIITSDHGEEFEQGQFKGRGTSLSEVTHRVPLIIYVPGHDLRRWEIRAARQVDLVLSILDLLGLPAEGLPVQGHSIFRSIGSRPIYLGSIGELRSSALIEDGEKIIHSFDSSQSWKVDLLDDPSGRKLMPAAPDGVREAVRRMEEFNTYNEAHLRDMWLAQQSQ